MHHLTAQLKTKKNICELQRNTTFKRWKPRSYICTPMYNKVPVNRGLNCRINDVVVYISHESSNIQGAHVKTRRVLLEGPPNIYLYMLSHTMSEAADLRITMVSRPSKVSKQNPFDWKRQLAEGSVAFYYYRIERMMWRHRLSGSVNTRRRSYSVAGKPSSMRIDCGQRYSFANHYHPWAMRSYEWKIQLLIIRSAFWHEPVRI